MKTQNNFLTGILSSPDPDPTWKQLQKAKSTKDHELHSPPKSTAPTPGLSNLEAISEFIFLCAI